MHCNNWSNYTDLGWSFVPVFPVKHPDGWAVKKGGSSRATKVFSTQADAIGYGRDVARNQQAEFLIHGRNGRIRAKDSYGNDPYPPEG